MASQGAKNLKKMFSEASEDDFEPLTFGELMVSQKFIFLPFPGDNSGHGGFRSKQWLFIKTQINVDRASPGLDYPKDNPHGRARYNNSVKETDFPHSMPVIRIDN